MRREGNNLSSYNDKQRCTIDYNRVSPYYHTLWGERLLHGYRVHGDESREEAQLQLVEQRSEAGSGLIV